jgi:predicted acyltransferase
MNDRDLSIDTLRGLAVLGMVLSGSIAFGDVLPAWMFHAQVPPPLHKFNPNVAGITWVDWVFPFFLFAMGAALPLAFQRYGKTGPSPREIWTTAVRRGAVLAALAIFTHQLRANVQVTAPAWPQYALSMLAFVVCGVALATQIGRWRVALVWRVVAAGVGIALLIYVQRANPTLTLAKSDIILTVLANMAFFGTLLYAYTRRRVWICVTVLLLVGAIWLFGRTSGSVAHWIYSATPLPWLYKFDYLKYLFIVVPGMFAGRWLLAHRENSPTTAQALSLSATALALLVGVTAALFARHFVLAIALSAVAGTMLFAVSLRVSTGTRNLAGFGLCLLAIGLALEPFSGGIKKDPSHFTYWFTTSGLACFSLIALRALAPYRRSYGKWMAEVGQNPLPAYVVGNLLLLPVMQLFGLHPMWAAMKQNAAIGLLKGVLFTAAAAAITVAMVRAKWIWRS